MAFEKRIDGKTLYEGVIVNVHMDRAQLVDGDVVRREVVEHPGGVTVIPVEPDGTVWCVRQFRYPFQREMLETPAGKLERGEDPAECARRELSEETGLTADELVDISFSRKAVKVFPNAKLIELSGAGHGVNMPWQEVVENSDAFIAAKKNAL